MTICKICGNTHDNKSYVAKEMMFGYKDKFKYFECAECGCLQINEIPNNIEKYYPSHYYSLQKLNYSKENYLKSLLRHQRAKYYLYEKNIAGFLLSKMLNKPVFYDWFKIVKIKLDSEILDVGCGVGHLLLQMQEEGFYHLTGIDPFIDNDIFYKNGLKILKKELYAIKKQFDFIMLNHSFEHMPQPLASLREIYRMLKSKHYVLLRIPVFGSFAWRKYNINWVQLDAPRHFFLHTIKSVQILAEQAGFKIANIVFDSTELQFWGSEQYLKDIPLRDKISYAVNPKNSIFSKKDIEYFKSKSAELNKNKDGDSACFYLYKT